MERQNKHTAGPGGALRTSQTAKQKTLPHLYGIVGLLKQVPAADAAVDAAKGHVEAEREEVAVVEMAHTVVQPSWKCVQ